MQDLSSTIRKELFFNHSIVSSIQIILINPNNVIILYLHYIITFSPLILTHSPNSKARIRRTNHPRNFPLRENLTRFKLGGVIQRQEFFKNLSLFIFLLSFRPRRSTILPPFPQG